MPVSNAERVAEALVISLSVLVRHLRHTRDDSLSMPEKSALARLEQHGPATVTALAKLERISAQSIGATLQGLEARGLITRSADPHDGRQALITITAPGRELLRSRQSARVQQLAQALADDFTREELEQLLAATPLLERLALNL
jgi:DNA-binding MarR family transcriptional regulator